jgi:hypothetical protein
MEHLPRQVYEEGRSSMSDKEQAIEESIPSVKTISAGGMTVFENVLWCETCVLAEVTTGDKANCPNCDKPMTVTGHMESMSRTEDKAEVTE